MARTITTGDEMPADFPLQAYNAFHSGAFVSTFDVAGRHPAAWEQYGGAINAVPVRFLGMHRAHEDYRRASSPTGSGRTGEDIAMHGFFVCALSSVECCSYAAYAVLSMIDIIRFPVTGRSLRRLTAPNEIARLCAGDAALNALEAAFRTIDQSQNYQQLADIRNALTHRQVLPRDIPLAVNEGASSGSVQPLSDGLRFRHLHLPTTAPLSLDVEPSMLDPYRAWVVTALTAALDGLQAVAALIPRR
jgi:hypothetical protein